LRLLAWGPPVRRHRALPRADISALHGLSLPRHGTSFALDPLRPEPLRGSVRASLVLAPTIAGGRRRWCTTTSGGSRRMAVGARTRRAPPDRSPTPRLRAPAPVAKRKRKEARSGRALPRDRSRVDPPATTGLTHPPRPARRWVGGAAIASVSRSAPATQLLFLAAIKFQ
jgi:hypothetical protein